MRLSKNKAYQVKKKKKMKRQNRKRKRKMEGEENEGMPLSQQLETHKQIVGIWRLSALVVCHRLHI